MEKQIFKVASVKQSIDHLRFMLDNHSQVHYVRFGNGELGLMNNKSSGRHKASPELKKELIETISIKDDRFIKAAVLGYPKEPGMRIKLFIDGSVKSGRLRFLHKLARRVTDERTFYNPVVFHYLSAYDPVLLKDFINTYIKSKTKMFVGGNDKEAMELLYGSIDYYIQTPKVQAYYSINQWWPKIEKDIRKCKVLLPSAGAASKIISKRLWFSDIDIHCIDMGSLHDILDGDETRGWIERTGINRLRKNLLTQ